MRLIVTLVQLVAAIAAVFGALLLLVGLFADEIAGEFATLMGVPLTPAGALLMIGGIGLAAIVRHVSGAETLVLDLGRFRRPPTDGR